MKKILKTIKLIESQVKGLRVPSVTQVSWRKDPYLILVSCILSLRTQDNTTVSASKRLFKIADTPKKILKLSRQRLQNLIYPVGFYRNKSKAILELSRKIIQDYNGKVPNKPEELLKLKGVGRKTANLVLGLGYGVPSICVDTHVHRISNRLGWVNTGDPHQTEEALEKIIPKKYWIDLNTTLVTFGQNVCVPISPHCNRCYVRKLCKRVGVIKSR
jgi:endonuclease-3